MYLDCLLRQRRRELLWGLAGFVVCQLGLAVALECWLQDARDPEYAAKELRLLARIAEAPARLLVLVLGTSRTKMGLDARRLSDDPDGPLVFNFGLAGSGPMMDLVSLRRLLSTGVRPDRVVVELLPTGLSRREGCPAEECWLDAARLRAGEVAAVAPYCNERQRLLSRWLKGRALPCYRHQAELRDELALDIPTSPTPSALAGPIDDYGWECHPDVTDPTRRQEYTDFARRQHADAFANYRFAPQPVHALSDLFDLCDREGIPVALLLMPEGTAFRALYPAEMLAALDAYLDELRRERHIPVIDARTWVEDTGFWDANHLSASGAAVFTDRFRREVLRPDTMSRVASAPRVSSSGR
jgi:hypothetical protein